MIRAAISYVRRHHVALAALLVACSGTAYAASSIGSNGIRDDSIRSRDVKKDSLTGADVKQGSLKPRDLAPGATGPEIVTATVLDDSGVPQVFDNEGLESVQRVGVGQFELAVSDGGSTCNYAATLEFPAGGQPGTGTIGVTEADRSSVTLTTFDETGTPADLGAELGWGGFAVVGACP